MAAQLRDSIKQLATYSLPRRTLLKLRDNVPTGLRSRFVTDAIEEKLKNGGGLRGRLRANSEEEKESDNG